MYTKFLKATVGLVMSMVLMTSIGIASEVTGTITTGVGTGVGGVVISSPLYTPAASTFVTSTSVTLTAPSSTAICYRADLVDPTCPTAVTCGVGDTLYTGAITLGNTTTLKARACFPGDGATVATSSVSTATYTLAAPTSGGGGSAGGGGGGQSAPFITPILPVATGGKPLNQTVICRAADMNTPLLGLSASSGKIYINGQLVPTVSTPITTNASGLVTLLEMSYTPSSTLYPNNSVVTVLCSAATTNGTIGTSSYQFSVASTGIAEVRAGSSSTTTSGSGVTIPTGSGATVSNFFTDTKAHWAEQVIESLHVSCQVNGYTDHNGQFLHLFKPEKDITRAELITMLMRCKYGTQVSGSGSTFADVAEGHWAHPYVQKAASLEIVKGYTTPEGIVLFSPNQSATRAEALKMILLTFLKTDAIKDTSPTLCTDVPEDAWYKQYFNYAVGKKIVTGYLDGEGKSTGMCKPLNQITRAESAALLMRTKTLSK